MSIEELLNNYNVTFKPEQDNVTVTTCDNTSAVNLKQPGIQGVTVETDPYITGQPDDFNAIAPYITYTGATINVGEDSPNFLEETLWLLHKMLETHTL
jgi:hypothetical protein